MSSTLQTARDIPLLVTSPQISGERRITPSWSISQLKSKLEPITGIPPSAQSLSLILPGSQPPISISAADETATQLSTFPLSPAAEIRVEDTRPPGLQQSFSLTDPRNKDVEKYVMPERTYEGLSDSVLAWKKSHKLGRFDPSAPEQEREKSAATWTIVEQRGITVGQRCEVGEDSSRRGVVRFVGEIEELPGVKGGAWVGVELDEPVGRNEGFVGEAEERRRVFECGAKRGVFVRPERVLVGDEFGVLETGLEDEDMEEI